MRKPGGPSRWKDVWQDIGRKLSDNITLTITGLLDSLYLIGWVWVQWLVNRFVAQYELVGMDALMLRIFQVLFAFTTIVPPCLSIYRDFRIMLIRINQEVQGELERKSQNRNENERDSENKSVSKNADESGSESKSKNKRR